MNPHTLSSAPMIPLLSATGTLRRSLLLILFTSLNWVSYQALAQNDFAISGPTQICPDGSTIYTYTAPFDCWWNISGGQIIGLLLGNSVQVKWSIGSGTLSASATFDGGNCYWDDSQYPPVQICDPPVTVNSSLSVTGIEAGVVRLNGLEQVNACNYASGAVTLTGNTVPVVRWEQFNGSSWSAIANTTATLSYSVTSTTTYRAVVSNGSCTSYSNQFSVIIYYPLHPAR